MDKPTPGPWSYRPDEHDDWGIVRAPVTEQGRFLGGVICQARDPEALDELTLAAHRGAKTDPWEANARLIAAAPELLEALTALFDDYKSLADSGDAGFWSLEDQPVGKQALAAIAKALGQ